MADEINITIDGVSYKTKAGKMVLEAAIDAGVYVPYLCYHPGMKPYAACRMCVVEVEGGRGYPASCTLPVQDGMSVRTTTNEVYELRRSIMEMLISEHPHGCLTCHRVDLCGPQDICLRHVSVNDRCVVCPKNERCELKDTTRFLDMDLESALSYQYRNLPIETGDPFYDRDYNLCIVCGRCVRACEELRGDNAITFTDRSGKALVGTSQGTSLLESGCEFCGACIDVCPVGALVESDHKWEKAKNVEKTVCPHCPVGCQLNLELNKFDKVIRVVPELNSPANKGQACFKGKFGLEFVNHKERLTTPLIRRDGVLEKATWEEALDYVAERLPRYKGDQFAVLTAPDSCNEEHYLAQKFARSVMVTNNVDQTSDTAPELVYGPINALGHGAATNPIWDLEEARCILVFNANITEDQNVAAVPIKKAVQAGAQLVVIDPREVELTRYAALWLRPRPGSELTLLGGLLKSVYDQGLVDNVWVEENCRGLGDLASQVSKLDLDTVAAETGVSVDDVQQAARLYAGSRKSAVVYGLDNVPREIRRECTEALSNLPLMTGNLGRPHTGLYPMRRGANEQGAWDMGSVPGFLPGYKSLDSHNDRDFFEQAWGEMVPIEQGLDLEGVFTALHSSLKAMFVVGDGLVHSAASLGGVREVPDLMAGLDNLELLVVQDHFLGETAQKAHVVFPRSAFTEKHGTFTSMERRVQHIRPAYKVKNSQARPEWETICGLAQKMGASGFDFQEASEIMKEIATLVPDYAGISHSRLESEAVLVARPDPSNPLPIQVLYSEKEHKGLQLPCTGPDHPGTVCLFEEGFTGENRPTIAVPEFRTVPLNGAGDQSFLLVPGRVLYSDRPMEVVAGRLNSINRDELVSLNTEDAGSLGVAEGDPVELTTRRQSIRGVATLADSAHKGVVSITGLFGQMAVELDASDSPDPMASAPGLNIEPVTVSKAV